MVNMRRKAEDRLIYDAAVLLIRQEVEAVGGMMKWDNTYIGWEIGSSLDPALHRDKTVVRIFWEYDYKENFWFAKWFRTPQGTIYPTYTWDLRVAVADPGFARDMANPEQYLKRVGAWDRFIQKYHRLAT